MADKLHVPLLERASFKSNSKVTSIRKGVIDEETLWKARLCKET